MRQTTESALASVSQTGADNDFLIDQSGSMEALVVEKERERMAFVPKDFWVISGEAAKAGDSF